jgi:hypothetical protein
MRITEQSPLRLRKTSWGLSPKATFSEEVALVQNVDCGLFSAIRHENEFYASLSVCRKTVSEDSA